ncbi:FAD-binding oxidoreductase [Micromonospora profundi]|uniref:FAD-binding protein n=1 Tax=Micromonospora profundi TaxID=1420889 RepID=A0AAJ6HS57_9ACTN|nr:FAD-binding protein [Micromonospora profundi]WLS43309.1 FAD-binding protein [Micromonospora profundi]
MPISRRRFLGSAAASGAGATLIGVPSPAAAHVGDALPAGHPDAIVGRGDPRYSFLVNRGFNNRYVGSPDTIRLVYSAKQVERALDEAVRQQLPFTVRAGGHCLDALVDDPRFRLLLDVSEMKDVTFDTKMNAFAVEPGLTLGEMYRALYLGWGVTVPAGICPDVGVGGHILGGGYGALSRRFGLSVDYLHAVEVVTVGKNGRARTIVATRDAGDPHRDLWWAHTGGGGGNFGIVTKYWFRDPAATGREPSRLLPRPPDRLYFTWATWPWEGMTEADFVRLVSNHGAWHAANSGPDSPYTGLHSALHLNTEKEQAIFLEIRMDATVPDASRMLDDYIAAVGAGVGVQAQVSTSEEPWLDNTLFAYDFPESEYDRGKSKGSHLRRPLNEEQIRGVYRALTDPAYPNWCMVYLAASGGRVNAVAPDATAVPQRDSLFKLWVSGTWAGADQDAVSIDYVRRLYRGIHAATGGMPVPNEAQDGCYINYPDVDTRDPAWNTSGVPWHALYYKNSYRRLQQVKAKYDPLNVFRHALSIEPA